MNNQKNITLKTLPFATAQEVFYQGKNHLLTQMKKCEDDDSNCVYRNSEGLKCVGGCFISDDEYLPKFENNGWTGLVCFYKIPKNHCELIRDLQRIHDAFEPFEWEDKLKELAEELNLNYN